MNTEQFKAFWFAMNATFQALGQQGSLENIQRVMRTADAVARKEMTLYGTDAEIRGRGVPANPDQLAEMRAEQARLAAEMVGVFKAMFGDELFK